MTHHRSRGSKTWRDVLLSCIAAALFAPLVACGGGKRGSNDDGSDPDGPTELREIVLGEPPLEEGDPSVLSQPQPTVRDVLVRIDAVRRQKNAKGIFLRVGSFGGAWGRVGDLQQAFASVRAARKPVHCHFDMADSTAYLLLATSCDKISASPAGDLNLVGVSAHVFYARALLETLGVRADLMQIGRYKGAADTFTERDMPETTRESLGALLDDLHAALLQALVRSRRIPTERAQALLNDGPFDTHRAKQLGLIDAVAFDDEAREHARRSARAEKVRKVELRPEEEPMNLADILSALGGETPEPEVSGPRVALVYLEGTITDSEDETPDGSQSGAFVRALRRMANDDEIKALVLRIDSPGGSALASDRMWHAVHRFAKRKPVIASIGDMAASGGYYIASAATEVLASDYSLVGSIGVVGGKIAFNEVAQRAGVNVVVLEKGRHAAWASPARPFTDSERVVLEGMLRRTYERFLQRVMIGRSLSRERLLPAAEGRLMSGLRARRAGLVDHAGGLTSALARARKAGRLDPSAPVERWPPRKTLLDIVAEQMGAPSDASTLLRHAGPLAEPLEEAFRLRPLLLGPERVFVTLPYAVRIE